jgi:hypothetical protein
VGCGLEGVGSGLGCGAGAGIVSGFRFGSGGCGFGLRMLYVTKRCRATRRPFGVKRWGHRLPDTEFISLARCKNLVFCDLGVRVGDLGETVAMVVLAMGRRSQVIRSDTDTAVVTPNGLGIGGGCGFCFRSFHISDLLVRGTFHGMGNIVRRRQAKSGPK